MNVLIADDNKLNRKLLSAMLEAEGDHSLEAADGQEALDILEREPVDAIISDVLMSRMDGYRFCYEVRSSERFHQLPFIIYTNAYTAPADEKVALELGADALLKKSAPAAEIAGLLRQLTMPGRAGRRQRIQPEQAVGLMKAHNQQVVAKLAERNAELLAQTAALRASENHLRAIIEAEPECVKVVGPDGRLLELNPAGLKILEADSLAQAQQRPFLEYAAPEFRPALADLHQRVLQGEQGTLEFEIIGLHGTLRRVEAHAVPLRDAAGEIQAILAVTHDITELKRSEGQLRRVKEKLEQTNKDLRRKNQEIQNFYHTLSHELKTPLTSAREFVAIVMDGLAGPLTETQSEYLGIAKESCNQMRVCLNDLLDATRLETGKFAIRLRPASLAGLVQNVVTMMTPVATAKEISLRQEIQSGLPEVPIDAGRITQVISNLVNNALKFTSQGGRITVKLSATTTPSECLMISVRDTGRGIEPDQIELIFDRLYQVKLGDAATGRGLGLGLYLCRELVALHGGTIWAESEPGKGSTFSFVIPKAQRVIGLDLLIIDDDPALGELLRGLLEYDDLKVRVAKGGTEALDMMRQQVPDVVLLDLAMPGMDGPETFKEIRRDWGAIPVIVYTGYPDSDLMNRALESSPFTLLSKPCSLAQLAETVRRVKSQHDTSSFKRDRTGSLPNPEQRAEPPVWRGGGVDLTDHLIET